LGEIVYPRVIVQSLFGGVADYSEWTLRLDTQDGLGSNVLLLCGNGNRRNAFIIGGLPNSKSKKQLTFKDNHRFITEFNGLNQSVNNDGEYKILRRGPTKDDGTVKDSTNSGALIYLNKDGQIQIGYKDSIDSDFSSITLNKSSKILSLFSKEKMLFKTEKTAELTTTDGFKINPLNPDQQAFVRGTIYRKNEQRMNNQLAQKLVTAAAALASATTSVTTAGTALTVATPLLLVPVAGAMATSPLVGAASVALLKAAGDLAQVAAQLQAMAISIQSFEAQSNTYISTKHNFGETP
jgi:hypothetical protein